jgi:hypothetical protein
MKTYTKREVVELIRSINNVEYFDLDLGCSIEQVIKVNNLEPVEHVIDGVTFIEKNIIMENKEVVKLLRSLTDARYDHLAFSETVDQIIKDNNLEPFEPFEHVNGQWYWSEDKDVLLKYNNGQGAIGFVEGAFSYDWGFRKGNTIYAIPATDAEVLKSFKGEAIKRGLVKGCRFKGVYNNDTFIDKFGVYTMINGSLFLDNITIFNGKEWATPIKQEKLTLEERITAIENKL